MRKNNDYQRFSILNEFRQKFNLKFKRFKRKNYKNINKTRKKRLIIKFKFITNVVSFKNSINYFNNMIYSILYYFI